MHLTNILSYANFKMTEIKIQNDCRQKWIDKKYVETKNCAKTVLQCRILKASKSDVNG